ncbi:short-chain dehydrogenase TIC 32, chloroplastic [Aspergillus awamori]|uniref:Uncharacterized protein n=2 Tax=Aspergillus TaxID=5052 RepID=A0A3F3Q934_9EURO|nr:hypothetical protein BDQ94DRAFT_168642 [Aspergillus welwitschiae]GCB28075.1 short-chain dehydrogenase TIC 32, chloroplastic [Aspergillus awamori]GKZ58389.1 hypothetical protein AnigIFM49718_004207 [Aspergillus niger]RDH35645.1 hypothetical protein BDQ94DRAFT_168642 [Aspergillus welwitschiae]GKZ74889.1 hypothetical protein AnigIFM50267_001644 [Aspergillus niger]GLA07801.1 hypothetical protein AnigIFM60653_009040 [Aspergillus niger]
MRVMPLHPYIDGFWGYCRSKLGNILSTRELTRRVEQKGSEAGNIYVNAFFSGNIATEQWKAWDEYVELTLGAMSPYIFSIIGQSTQDSAATAIYLATSDRIRLDGISGQYYIPTAKPDADD